MIKLPASNTLRIFIIIFVFTILILILGAWLYKESLSNTAVTPVSNEIGTPVPETAPAFETANLVISPTESAGTYRVALEGLTEPLNGVAFQINDPQGGAELTGSTFSTDASLEQSGWSSAVNSSEDSETGKILSFVIVKASPTEELTETVSTVELGSLSFTNVGTGLENEISIVSAESFATYTSGKAARLQLVIE